MAVEAQALDHEALEVADEKIGQIEAAGLGLGLGQERVDAAIERVAMGPFDPLDAFLGQHAVELAAAAAVAIEHEDALVAASIGVDLGAHRRRDSLRAVVQLGRQAGQIEMRPAVDRGQRADLARERAAGDQQGARRHGKGSAQAFAAAGRLCRRAT